MKLLNKTIATFALLMLQMVTYAQSQTVEMATGLRSNGKIYVVVASCIIILVGLFAYMFIVDKKLSKLEKNSTTTKLEND
jgi:hypothetical protein